MTFWTEAQKLKAAKLWNDGASATEIAHVFGCSRNSVIGIAHRNRDQFKAKPQAPAQPRRRREQMARIIRPVVKRPRPIKPEIADEPLVEVVDAEFVPANPITFLQVTDRTCRWPLWSKAENPGGSGLCCGEPTDEGSSWCAHHRVKARQA